jgi:hypothetical protein
MAAITMGREHRQDFGFEELRAVGRSVDGKIDDRDGNQVSKHKTR